MILRSVLLLFLLQVLMLGSSLGRQAFLQEFRKIFPPGKLSPLPFGPTGFKRSRRCLSTALSLLWPQVVGPVDQGVIEESGYDVVPKTLLEYRLDGIRLKAKQEEESRLMIRDYMKKLTEAQDNFYGIPPYGRAFEDYT